MFRDDGCECDSSTWQDINTIHAIPRRSALSHSYWCFRQKKRQSRTVLLLIGLATNGIRPGGKCQVKPFGCDAGAPKTAALQRAAHEGSTPVSNHKPARIASCSRHDDAKASPPRKSFPHQARQGPVPLGNLPSGRQLACPYLNTRPTRSCVVTP